MKRHRFLTQALGSLLLALLAGTAALSAQPTTNSSSTFIPADDARIAYMGRISHRIPDAVTFTYPGVSIFANFEGTSLRMQAKPGSGDFMVGLYPDAGRKPAPRRPPRPRDVHLGGL